MLPNLTAKEMDWLVLGELQMALERAGGPGLRISGHIAARQNCDGKAGWGLALCSCTTERYRKVPGVGPGCVRGDLGSCGYQWAWGQLASTCLAPLQSCKVSFVGLMP